ncbi:2-keto-4-pentenoate hydratase [Gordonia sp. DT218]|uniref:2-keto-4-pentenoate hydratase n=1 Tax=Gordonia sp. DT218 TaxID=3416659 RepID=UPI003CEB4BB1
MSTTAAKGDSSVATATNIDDEVIARAAARLAGAVRTGRPCTAVRDLIGSDNVAAAYRVQEQFNALLDDGRRTVVGRKIGATSAAVQEQLGVDQPDFGVLFSDMVFNDGATIPTGRLLQPKAEAEVAFRLVEDLATGSLDVAQCRAAVGEAVAAIEVVDSRILEWDISFADTVADNASSGVFVLGSRWRSLTEFEPVDVAMSMSIDGVVVSSGGGVDCLGDPLNALSWLARRAREFGTPLEAGQIILSGALGPMRPLHPGAQITVTISGLGEVSASFTPDLEVTEHE